MPSTPPILLAALLFALAADGPDGTSAAPLPPSLSPRLSALGATTPPAPPPAPAATPTASSPQLLVEDVSDDLVSATGPVAGLKALQFGRVVDASGFTVARVMILRLLDKGLLATAVDGRARIKKGAWLRFDQAPNQPSAAPPPQPAAVPPASSRPRRPAP